MNAHFLISRLLLPQQAEEKLCNLFGDIKLRFMTKFQFLFAFSAMLLWSVKAGFNLFNAVPPSVTDCVMVYE
jgi:hypothetical protein